MVKVEGSALLRFEHERIVLCQSEPYVLVRYKKNEQQMLNRHSSVSKFPRMPMVDAEQGNINWIQRCQDLKSTGELLDLTALSEICASAHDLGIRFPLDCSQVESVSWHFVGRTDDGRSGRLGVGRIGLFWSSRESITEQNK
jgi:hypothetical protein